MDEKKYKLICVRKGKTNYARTNNRKNVTLGSYSQHNLTEYNNNTSNMYFYLIVLCR